MRAEVAAAWSEPLRELERLLKAGRGVLEHRVACEVTSAQGPLPVHVLYWTAFVGEDGAVHFAKDVYGRDEVLANAIAAR